VRPVTRPRAWPPRFTSIVVVFGLLVACGVSLAAQARREFSVTARRYAFDVEGVQDAVLRVRQDDLVAITFSAADIPHSLTIDAYRINKRAEPGKSVPFEFRADKQGEFVIYCSLANDAKCREETVARLIVGPRAPSDNRPK
jgi:heme/copper-type cytochrome/quinol oxidase subunit 2